MFAFDLRRGHPAPVVIIPFIPLDAEYAVEIATDFATFRQSFGLRRSTPSGKNNLNDEHRRGAWLVDDRAPQRRVG